MNHMIHFITRVILWTVKWAIIEWTMSAYPICNVGSHSNGWKSASPWPWPGCLPYPMSSTPGFSWSGFIWYPSNCYTTHKVIIYTHQLSIWQYQLFWVLNATQILRIVLNALLYLWTMTTHIYIYRLMSSNLPFVWETC